MQPSLPFPLCYWIGRRFCFRESERHGRCARQSSWCCLGATPMFFRRQSDWTATTRESHRVSPCRSGSQRWISNWRAPSVYYPRRERRGPFGQAKQIAQALGRTRLSDPRHSIRHAGGYRGEQLPPSSDDVQVQPPDRDAIQLACNLPRAPVFVPVLPLTSLNASCAQSMRNVSIASSLSL